MHKEDLVLNNLQWSICHKKLSQTSQLFRTLLGILADAVVWIVLIHSPISLLILFIFMLSVFALVAVIGLSLLFLMLSSSSRLNASTKSSMLARPLLPSLDAYYLPVSSLGYKALCITISFLVLWFICLSSSLVRFKNGSEYLKDGTALVFIPLMRFLLQSLVSRSFLVCLGYFSNFFFFHLRLFDGVCFQYSQVHVIFFVFFFFFFFFLRVFHISVSWWSFIGVWVTASLLNSPGLFSVFWPFSIM